MISAAEPTRRRRGRPSPRHAVASVLAHALVLVIGVAVAAQGPATPDFLSYHIELVALPQTEVEELVIEAPAPAPPPEPTPAPAPEIPPETDPEPAPLPQPPRAPAPTPPPPSQPAPRPTPAPTSGDAVNVRMEGLRRDYPVYYQNIITAIQRCFRWSGGGTPQTEVSFIINEDGSVGDLRFISRSGNPTFDFTALEAVECAGSRGYFGPLPGDLPYDQLPIRFTFRPGGGAGIFR